MGASSVFGTMRPQFITVRTITPVIDASSQAISTPHCRAWPAISVSCGGTGTIGAPAQITHMAHGNVSTAMTSKRIKRVERRQVTAATRGRETEDERQRQQPHGMRRGQQQQAGLDGQREPGIATALPDREPGMQQEHRPERTRQDQRAEFDAGRAKGRNRHGEQHGDDRLRAANDGAAELIDRTEGEDGADLRQQIDTENMIAGGPRRRCRPARTPAAVPYGYRLDIPGHRPTRWRDRPAARDTAAGGTTSQIAA